MEYASRFLVVGLGATLLGFWACLSLAAAQADPPSEANVRNTSSSRNSPRSIATPSSRPGKRAGDDLTSVVERVERSVVRVHARSLGLSKLGSGFVIDDRGWIITNLHVVQDSHRITVEFVDGKKRNVIGFWGADPGCDLVLLALDSGSPLPPLKLATEAPRKGEHVLAMGTPKGLSFSVSDGIVASLRSGKEIDTFPEFRPTLQWVQTTAPISSGNSGGPLLNMSGEVIGVNTWTRVDGQNLNFALASQDVAEFYKNNQTLLKPLEKLPRAKEVEKIARRNQPPRNVVVSLPDNQQVDLDALFLAPARTKIMAAADSVFGDAQRRHRLDPDTAWGLKHANGRPALVALTNGTKLHGDLWSFYEAGNLATYAQFAQGQLQGSLLAFNQDGTRKMFAQYLQGKNDGYCCVFNDDQLACIMESARGKAKAIHIIEDGAVTHTFREFTAVVDSELSAAMKQISELNKAVRESERLAKGEIHKRDEALRRARASALGAERTRAATERIRVRNQAATSAVREMQRRAHSKP